MTDPTPTPGVGFDTASEQAKEAAARFTDDPTPNCPACGHDVASHPHDRFGVWWCSRSLDAPPSCRECAEPMEQLLARKVGR